MDILQEFADHVKFRLSPKHDLVTVGLGCAGEAGEIADLIKKFRDHGIPWDFDKLDLEMGDELFYIQAYCQLRGTSLQTIMEKNISKLEKRYPQGFTPGGGIRD